MTDFGSHNDGIGFDPSRFSGVVRVFPLPAPALYPGVVLPLHLFEQRYLAMMEDALRGDGLIAMAVLRPGWEDDYAGRPPLEEVACLGQIVTHHVLEDGRYNLLLAGVGRVRLGEEVAPPQAFRRARATLLSDRDPGQGDPVAATLHQLLTERFRQTLPHGEPPEPLQQVFDGELPLGRLADLVAHTLPLPRDLKQAVLAETEATHRAHLLVSALTPNGGEEALSGLGGRRAPDSDDFLPPFSQN